MAKGKKDMQMKERIQKQRDQLLKDIEIMTAKVAGLEMALATFNEPDDAASLSVAASGNASRAKGLKNYVIGLLQEAGVGGLSAAAVVEMAALRGKQLDRGSVSSLLSRLKKDDVATYDGEKYRLRQQGASVEPIIPFEPKTAWDRSAA